MNRLGVFYEGQRVGELALPSRGGLYFEYAPEFLSSGHELSPLRLPLGSGAFSRRQPATVELHGLFEDSLPDSWGTRIMNDWFRARGVGEAEITPVMRLAYIGDRGFGALTYAPAELVEPSDQVLTDLYAAAAAAESGGAVDLAKLAAVGSSAGGARPKVAVWISKEDGALHSRASSPDDEAWIVKFDVTSGRWFGAMEHAYARLARAAGVDFPETRLWRTEHEDGVRRHFAVKRFDRVGQRRIHYHSLAAMYQTTAGDLDYQTFLRVTRRVTQDHREVLKAFRRAVFNVAVSNRDDHGKNHGFLYEGRQWRLSPAFDVTYASAAGLPERGMAVMGERRKAGVKELRALAAAEGLEKKEVASVLEEVADALKAWAAIAAHAGVPEEVAFSIGRDFQG